MMTWTHGSVPADIRAGSTRVFEGWAANTVVRNERGRIDKARAEFLATLDKGAWFADGRLGAWTLLCRGVLLLTASDGTTTEIANGHPGSLRIVAETLDEQTDLPSAEEQLRAARMNRSLLPSAFMATLTEEEQRRHETRPVYQRKVGGSRKAKIQLTGDAVMLFSETQSSASKGEFVFGGNHSHTGLCRAVPASTLRSIGVAAALRVIAAKTARPSSIPYLEDLAIAA